MPITAKGGSILHAESQRCLELNGWSVAESPGVADLILFNACGIVDKTEEFSMSIIRELQRGKRLGARLIVCGCLPRINPRRLAQEYGDVSFGSDDVDGLIRAIDGQPGTAGCCANNLMPYTEAPAPRLTKRIQNFFFSLHPIELRTRNYEKHYDALFQRINIVSDHGYFIKAATGCLNECSYCAVKLSRGSLKSRPIDTIVGELKAGLAQGYTEFCLIGTDLGCYGRDRGTTLVDLLREMASVPGAFTIKLRNVNARFLIMMAPELAGVFRSGKIQYMSSAVQSGSNKILKLMSRGYTVEEYKDAVGLIKTEYRALQLRTQVIIGFPGETDSDFDDTLRVVRDVDFDFVEVHLFSARAGTRAFDLPGRVSTGVILKRRYRMLKAVMEKCGGKQQLAN